MQTRTVLVALSIAGATLVGCSSHASTGVDSPSSPQPSTTASSASAPSSRETSPTVATTPPQVVEIRSPALPPGTRPSKVVIGTPGRTIGTVAAIKAAGSFEVDIVIDVHDPTPLPDTVQAIVCPNLIRIEPGTGGAVSTDSILIPLSRTLISKKAC